MSLNSITVRPYQYSPQLPSVQGPNTTQAIRAGASDARASRRADQEQQEFAYRRQQEALDRQSAREERATTEELRVLELAAQGHTSMAQHLAQRTGFGFLPKSSRTDCLQAACITLRPWATRTQNRPGASPRPTARTMAISRLRVRPWARQSVERAARAGAPGSWLRMSSKL